MQIGILSFRDLSDPVLYWICRDIEKLPLKDIQVSVIAPDIDEAIYSNLGGMAKRYLSTTSKFDLLLVFGTDQIDGDSARLIRTLDCKKILICGSFTDDAVMYRAKSVLSFYSNNIVETFEERIHVPDLLSLNNYKYFGGFSLDGAEKKKTTLHTDNAVKKTILFSASKEEIEAARPILDNTRSSSEIIVLTNGSIKSSLLEKRFLCDVYSLSEAPLEHLFKNAERLIDISTNDIGDIHRYLLISAMSQGVKIFSRKEVVSKLPHVPSFVGGGSTQDFLHSALTTIQDKVDRIERVNPQTQMEIQNYRNQLVSLFSHAGAKKKSNKKTATKTKKAQKKPPSKYCFLAINGNGLGHAQRVVSVAKELESLAEQKSSIEISSFVTCVDFIQANGLDVVPLMARTGQESEPSIEFINFKRLSSSLSDASVFIFDGGYPYDSVISASQMFDIPSVWIRRGLWREDQDNRIALDREKYFDHIIRPLEVFDEINTSFQATGVGRKELSVGPIVSRPNGAGISKWMAKNVNKENLLVVTMLGGGFISDRSNMLYSICKKMEQYENIDHLAVSWPQARFDIRTDEFQNTKFISTNFASALVDKADLYIGAAGYNSFHEVVYYQTPAIFVPQSAPWLDDQEARAASAAERGIGISVDEGDLLGLVGQIEAMLEGGGIKKCLDHHAKLELRETGNLEAAKMILQIEESF